jgi:hypothetical protein
MSGISTRIALVRRIGRLNVYYLARLLEAGHRGIEDIRRDEVQRILWGRHDVEVG